MPHAQPPPTTSEDRLEIWMAKLLDLSRRNKLLNFKPGRSVTLGVPDAQALAQRLLAGNKVTLLSYQGTATSDPDETSSLALLNEEQKNDEADALQRGRVFAQEPEAELEKRLISLYRDARTAIEEGGANILYLALGFLSWRQDAQGTPCRAPLILIPVSLHRRDARAKFVMQAHADEPRFNPILVEMLRQDFRLQLQIDDLFDDTSDLDPSNVWTQLRTAIASFTDWEVTEEVVLSTFSFAKYLMWLDLKRFRERKGLLNKNRVVRHLLNTEGSAHQPNKPFLFSDTFSAGEFDEYLNPAELFCPLPADSSQLAAILAARQGKDFVLEGPPGTGKSQTIANLIAQFLSEGKTVLFVSEKAAALEVVYRRLRQVGLGDFCLELHSNKARKGDVLKQLNAAWNSRGAKSPEQWAAKAQELKKLRDDLNRYVQRLHYRHPNGLSVFAAIGTISKNNRLPAIALAWESPETHNAEYLEQLREVVKKLSVQAHVIGGGAISAHPLRLIGKSVWSPRWQKELITTAEQLLSIIQECRSTVQTLSQAIGLALPVLNASTRKGLSLLATTLPNAFNHNWSFAAQADAHALSTQLLKGATLLRKRRALNLSLTIPWPDSFTIACEQEHVGLSTHGALYATQASDPVGKSLTEKTLAALDSYKSQLTKIAQHRTSLSAPYSKEIETLDIEQLHSDWEQAEQSIWFKSWFLKRRIRKQLRTTISGKEPFNAREDLLHWKALRELRGALEIQRQEIEKELSHLSQLREATDGLWQGTSSAPVELESAFQFQTQLARAAALLTADPKQITAISEALHLLLKERNTRLSPDREVAQHCEHLPSIVPKLETAHEALAITGEFGNKAKRVWNSSSLDELTELCQNIIQAAPKLSQWCVWQEARAHAANSGLLPLAHAIEQGLLSPDQALAAFETSYARCWLDKIVEQEEVISRFGGTVHEQKIRDFGKIDDELTMLSRDRLCAQLFAGLPNPNMLSAAHAEWRVLLREIQKKKRHLPLRRLFAEIPNALTKLTPCLLMSPISIAQYLSVEGSTFDLVVFDEASQIPTWEAIGAMARGTQVVMVGDPKQLPPSSFFDRIQGPIDDDAPEIPDLDSILDECIASGLYRCQLNWHYRSRHESLITFSNRCYYTGNLITFPSPETNDNAVSVTYVNGTHNQVSGGDKTNSIEAQALVDEIVKRLLSDEFRRSGKTIGVVTFNRAQQQFVADLFDTSRRQYPQIEPYFSDTTPEPIFIKSLEEVQGDERDIIYFSLTYGPNEAGRLLLTSLSQLTRQGGERRLNVAITRARHQMRLFASFRPEHLHLTNDTAKGLQDLKRFLEFAERGVQALIEANQGSLGAYESPFEESVAAKLIAKGWHIAPQIGVSSFRIDLGVIDPDQPNRYLAGVECDGATYHRSATARDRDKLRQLILEGLGWNILRVWSTDWWLNENDILEQLDRQLHTLLQTRRSERALAAT